MQRSQSNRRRRRVRRRRGRFSRVALALMLVLGLAGLGAKLLMDNLKQETLTRYPLEYVDLIQANARQQGLEPAYVAAVILAESSYDPNAVSRDNAQGLMQILPSTGEWIASKFDESYVEGCLFDPETNIRYGCWYLGFLMHRYDGDKRCSSAAYHSGQGTVDDWLKNPEYSADGRSLDVIAGSNADTYVNRVLEYYEKYEEIFARLEAA